MKRVIPCLDVNESGVVKGVRFENLRAMGDPVELAARYDAQGADELVFLDVSATLHGRRPLLHVLERVSERVFLPVTAGGGVDSLVAFRDMLLAGADRVAVNTADAQFRRGGGGKRFERFAPPKVRAAQDEGADSLTSKSSTTPDCRLIVRLPMTSACEAHHMGYGSRE